LRDTTLSDQEFGPGNSIRPLVLAWLYADLGDYEQARSWADRLARAVQARGIAAQEGLGRWALAEALRRAGHLEDADKEIQAALAMATPLDRPGVLATLSALRLAQGRKAEALAAAEEGVAIYEAIGAYSAFLRPAFLLLVHAECLEASGRREDASAVLVKARARLLEIAATIGEDEYRKTFLESVPENRRILELAEQWAGDG
jgi:tetratricopeptide (TPR) repeat protein